MSRPQARDTLALYLLTAFTFVLCAAVIVLGEGWL